MQTTDEKRQALIRSVLPDDGVPAGQAAELVLRAWRRLAERLIPLVGEAGFCALYGRAMRRVAGDHPCLAAGEAHRTSEALLQALGRDLVACGSEAAAVNAALLDLFIALLSTLIGGELTNRILVSAWGTEQRGSETKELRK